MEESKMNNITITNKEGLVVVKLYVKDNGNIHEDSWICLNGWGSKPFSNGIERLQSVREAAEAVDWANIIRLIDKYNYCPFCIERIKKLQQDLATKGAR